MPTLTTVAQLINIKNKLPKTLHNIIATTVSFNLSKAVEDCLIHRLIIEILEALWCITMGCKHNGLIAISTIKCNW